jgi:hypothetical protein
MSQATGYALVGRSPDWTASERARLPRRYARFSAACRSHRYPAHSMPQSGHNPKRTRARRIDVMRWRFPLAQTEQVTDVACGSRPQPQRPLARLRMAIEAHCSFVRFNALASEGSATVANMAGIGAGTYGTARGAGTACRRSLSGIDLERLWLPTIPTAAYCAKAPKLASIDSSDSRPTSTTQ